jgi:transcriptional regulator with XRE-family HTH domain
MNLLQGEATQRALPGQLLRISNARLPKALANWRTGRGWSQAAAAEFLQVSRRTYESWEQGRNLPRGIGRVALVLAISQAERADQISQKPNTRKANSK